MPLTLQELRESGLLELYVLGELDSADRDKVEAGIKSYPELREDLRDIEKALHFYASAHAIPAPSGNLEKVLQQINNGTPAKDEDTSIGDENKSGNWLKWILGLAILGLFVLTYFQAERINKLSDDFKILQEECETQKEENRKESALYAELSNLNNDVIEVAATEKFPETKLLFYHNNIDKKNFIQVQNLPQKNSDQSYQLWSLKGTDPPIPLDIFEGDDRLIEVQHVEGSNAYAITIEPKGGSPSPTMDDLIGVFSI